MIGTMLGNWQTTLIGFVAAVFVYLAQLGPNLPTTRAGWGQALVAASIAAFGIVSKDAMVGSKPGA